MKTKITIFFILAMLHSFANGQQSKGVVQGKIKDKETGILIPFANFFLLQDSLLKYKSETDFNGNFKISGVEPGTYTVNVFVSDYTSKILKGFLVKANTINFIDVELEKTVRPSDKKRRRKNKK